MIESQHFSLSSRGDKREAEIVLTINGPQHRLCDGVSRRNFIRIGALGMGGLTMPQLLQAEKKAGIGRSGKSIIMISFFRSIPMDYEESAKLDGASNVQVLAHIVVPLSKPILATMTLFYAVFRWNSWFDVLMYVSDPNKYTLQIVLKNLIDSTNGSIMTIFAPHESALLSVQGAAVLFTILPILIIYPFLQKYFVKGVMIGGIKG